MALILTEEQSMLRDSARDFLAGQSPVSALRALRDSGDPDGFSRPLWRQFAEMGFSGVLVPENLGGLGLGHVEAGVVMEQIGRHLTASPFLASSVTAVTALCLGGSTAQKERWLPRLANSEAIATLAVDEGGKHRPLQISTSCIPEGDGLVINGAKTFVLDAHVADLLVVAVRTAGEPGDRTGISLCLVDAKASGVEIERTVMVDAHNAARLTLRNVRVDTSTLLGVLHDGVSILDGALDAARAAAAAELLGVAGEAFNRTVEYLKQRRQFGRLIGEFQGLQHRAAQLYTELEVTRAAVIKAQQLLDQGASNASDIVAVAKARAGRTATLAVQEAVQMHGGIGMTDEFEIGFFMKRARVLQELFGDANFQLDQVAQRRGY
ncbi:MAG: acyl-CoA dehydrogenase [Betaproteobacteria bacterium]|jgi:alkylation response protein AidB-like acyl-CoA dehydrogenase